MLWNRFLSVALLLPVVAMAQMQDGRYDGTLTCSELLIDPSQGAFSAPLTLYIVGHRVTWTRTSRTYQETGDARLIDNKFIVDVFGSLNEKSAQTSGWRTTGTVVQDGPILSGQVRITSRDGSRLFRNCSVAVRVVPIEVSIRPAQPASPIAIFPARPPTSTQSPTQSRPSVAVGQATTANDPQLNQAAADFVKKIAIDLQRQQVGNKPIESLAADRYEEMVRRSPSYGREMFQHLECGVLGGPGKLHQMAAEEIRTVFSDSGTAKPPDLERSGFLHACPSERPYAEGYLAAIRQATEPIAIEMRKKITAQRDAREKDRLSVIASDEEKKRTQAKVDAENQQRKARQREQAQNADEQRQIELKSGRAKVESFQDAVLLHNAKDCNLLILRPPFGAQPGVCIFFGLIAEQVPNGLIVDISNHLFIVQLHSKTVYLGATREGLSGGSFTRMIGTYIQSDQGVAVFRAMYVLQ